MASVLPTLPHLNIVEENDLYAVGWVRDMDEMKEVLSAFMGKTNMDYRMYRKTKDFGHRGKSFLFICCITFPVAFRF